MCAKHWLEFQYGDTPPPPKLVALIDQAGSEAETSVEDGNGNFGATGSTVDSFALDADADGVQEELGGDSSGQRPRGVRSSLTKPTLDTIVEADAEGDVDSPSTSSGTGGPDPDAASEPVCRGWSRVVGAHMLTPPPIVSCHHAAPPRRGPRAG